MQGEELSTVEMAYSQLSSEDEELGRQKRARTSASAGRPVWTERGVLLLKAGSSGETALQETQATHRMVLVMV